MNNKNNLSILNNSQKNQQQKKLAKSNEKNNTGKKLAQRGKARNWPQNPSIKCVQNLSQTVCEKNTYHCKKTVIFGQQQNSPKTGKRKRTGTKACEQKK